MSRKPMLPLVLLLLCVASACSVKKNTGLTRFYHSFTTRYNVYYNGSVAFRDGKDAIMKGNQDFYADILPLEPISNEKTVGQGSGDFDRAIEKSEKSVKLHSIRKKPKKKSGKLSEKKKRWYKQKEYNPFLYRAWLMMGQAQYWKGEYLEAAATFSYMARLYEEDPEVLPYARIWMARCYAQLDWFYDAENYLNLTRTDGYADRHKKDFVYTETNYLLRQGRYEEALPLLQRVIKNERNKKQRHRELFLLGQIYQHLGRNREAYDTYAKLIRKSPPYEMEFNARIRQTEVLSAEQNTKVVKKLKRMAKNQKNKTYLDQIYYAIGNTYLAKGDTLQAMEQYREAAKQSTRNGKEKAVALLTLGQLCWDRMEHTEAQQCYKDALGLIDKEYPGFEMLSKRSAVLDELVGYSAAVQLQDSLQHLASLPEEEQIKIVDRIIEELKKKEEEERKAQEEAELLAQHLADQAENAPTSTQQQTVTPNMPTTDRSWYFYNSQLVAQGKTLFQNQWGSRKLEDNWRRRNKTTVATSDYEAVDYAKEDSLKMAQELALDSLQNDSLAIEAQLKDSLENDPHQREYYLKQIPKTEEQMAESHRILSDGLFNMGLIYKDKLEDEPLTTKVWSRLIEDYPDFERLDEVYYNMYLMYLRYKQEERAEYVKARLIDTYPDSKFALTVADPDFLTTAYYGEQLEDSLYEASYNAFKEERFDEVVRNDEYAAKKYAMGQHRPKFLFLHGMAALRQGDRPAFLSKLKEVTQNYPENEITALAADIMKGLQEGRLLAEGSSFGSIWTLRANELAGDTTLVDTLSNAFQPDKDVPYMFLLAYPEGEVNEDRMLYEIARFNFSSFIVKDFDLSFAKLGLVRMLCVKPFASLDEVRYYMHLLYKDPDLAVKLSGLRAVIISEHNYDLLMKYYSFDDYARFYEATFGELPTMENMEELPPETGNTLDEPLQNLPELPEGEEYDMQEDEIIQEDEFID